MAKKNRDIVEDCRMIVPAIEKGSQGKSTTLGHIIEWLRVRHANQVLRAFDPDHIHRTLWRTFGPEGLAAFSQEEPHRIERLTLSSGKDGFAALDAALDAFADGSIVLVDGVAQGFEAGYGRWANSLNIEQAKRDLNFRITFILNFTSLAETLTQGVRVMREHMDRADYLVVLAEPLDGTANKWDLDGAVEARQLAEDLGAQVLRIPAFLSQTALAMNPPGDNAPLPTLRSIATSKTMRYSEKNRAGNDWASLMEKLDAAASVLLPPAAFAAAPAKAAK